MEPISSILRTRCAGHGIGVIVVSGVQTEDVRRIDSTCEGRGIQHEGGRSTVRTADVDACGRVSTHAWPYGRRNMENPKTCRQEKKL